MSNDLAINPAFELQVTPKCALFGTCGGCSHQNLTYKEQLELKRSLVVEALCHPEWSVSSPNRRFASPPNALVGGLVLDPRLILSGRDPDSGFPLKACGNDNSFSPQNDNFVVHPTLPSPKPYGYRHMIALSVKRRQGKLQMGFIGQDRRSFLPVESCPISDDRINQFLPSALQKLEELPPERKFNTSQVVLRVGTNGDVITSIRTDRGKHLQCTVLGKTFSFSMSSFFQNNFSILEAFITAIHKFLSPMGTGALFDLYSGVGLIGILMAEYYESVIGIEEGYEAVKFAQENAAKNRVTNISFLEGKVENLLLELTKKTRRPLHVVVDPPRVGLKPEVIRCLASLPIDRFVYVSCHLEALRRDLTLLSERFKIVSVQPLDFFPQTKHVETLVLLEPHG